LETGKDGKIEIWYAVTSMAGTLTPHISVGGLTNYSKKLVFLMCVFMILGTVLQLFY